MKHVDVILGHDVEYRDSMSRLPILVPECSKGSHMERVEIWLFEGVKLPEISWGNQPPFPGGVHYPGPPAPCAST